MTDDQKSVFSKKSILDKQQLAKEEYDRKVQELRKAFEDVASTVSGENALRYLFLLCGGDLGSVRRDKDQAISVHETLVTLGAKSVWETIRYNLSSETIKRLERHNWEQ